MDEFEKFKRDFQNFKGIGIPIAIVLALFLAVKSSYYTVDADEEAVLIRLGKYVDTYPPGFHFKLPFGIDKEIHVKTKRVLQVEFGFRTANLNSRRTTYSSRNYSDESLMLTGDLNVADVDWVVQYQISHPFKYIFQTSEPVQNIRDVSESIMRRVVGDRLVTEVLTTGRLAIATESKLLIQEVLDKYDMGVKVVSVKLQGVNPPDRVKKSFNEVNEAKQEQEKVINEAEEAYNKVIPEARGKAEKRISEAEGYASALINHSLGDAERFSEILRAYKKAPKITRKRIYLETMESILKKMNDMTIVDPKIKGIMPLYQTFKSGVKSE
jgi:modulator of FtsH protease HflK